MASSVKVANSGKQTSPLLTGNRDILLLLVLMAILFFYRLGSYPLFDLDEPRYAEAAREMLERGNWVTPYFNYELRFDKPVLFYWLVALSYKLFGLSEFAARFSSAVAASVTALMVYTFGRYWLSRQFGFYAALILTTSVLFIGIARMSITDMTLTCFMTATTLCLFMAAHHHLRWWLAAGAFAGLAVLTKGPVGIVVPGAIFTLYTLIIGDFRRCLINQWLPLALLVCLGVALPWYILAYQQNGPIFLDMLFLHNVTRFSDVVSGHKQPVYFYVIVLLAGFLPWTVYLPATIQTLWNQAKTHRQQIQSRNFHYLVPLYATVWTAFIFIFFTMGHTKLLTYILPLFPALALLLAETWQAKQNQEPAVAPKGQWFTIPAWTLVAVTLIGGILFTTQMDRLLPREAAGIQANGYNIAAVFIMLTGMTTTAWLISKKKLQSALLSQAVTLSLLLVVAMQGIVPNVSKAAQGVMMDYLAKTGRKPLVIYEIQRPSLTFYGQRRIPRFVEEDRPELIEELNKNKHTYVITKNVHLSDFNQLLPSSMQVHILEKGAVYSLLSVSQAP
jgi:4-amino-4-deoxy-L-arabinose transferase-like glycosyltransferase